MTQFTDENQKCRGADATTTRNKIIQAARTLFVEKGFNGASMREIAKQAGVTQSLLHHHFGNKETLWQMVKLELTNEYFEEIARQVESNQASEQKNLINETIENRFRFMQKNPDIIRIALWQKLDDCQTRANHKSCDLLKHLIDDLKAAQDTGKLRNDISPAIITTIIFILTSGWFKQDYHWILEQDTSTPINTNDAEEAYLTAIKKLIAQGLWAPV